MNEYIIYYNFPIGTLKIKSTEFSVISVEFVDKEEISSKVIPYILKETYKQLKEYFDGTRKEFNLKMSLDGTDFQKKVWNELINIPYGQVVTYGYIAKKIGNEKACRAVGNANNKNKISIIIPCHRVIGSNGKLVGYAEGINKKEWLLNHEKRY